MNESPTVEPDTADRLLRAILKRQYHSALAMLRESIELCPPALWTDASYRTVFWQGAYHALFFSHFYMCRDEHSFVPWPGHHAANQNPDGIPGPPDPESPLPLTAPPYTKAEMLAFWQFCADFVDPAVDAMDLRAETSGFHWYPIPKLEHQLVNLRHIQHHMAQLADRVRKVDDVGVKWVGARRPAARS